MVDYVNYDDLATGFKALLAAYSVISEPTSYDGASKDLQ